MNSAHNQKRLDEQSRRLTQFVIGIQKCEFIRLFNEVSIGPAALVESTKLSKNVNRYKKDVINQSKMKRSQKKTLTNLEEKQHAN